MYTEQSSSLLSSLDFSHVKDYRHIKSSLNRHVSHYDLLLPPGTSRYWIRRDRERVKEKNRTVSISRSKLWWRVCIWLPLPLRTPLVRLMNRQLRFKRGTLKQWQINSYWAAHESNWEERVVCLRFTGKNTPSADQRFCRMLGAFSCFPCFTNVTQIRWKQFRRWAWRLDRSRAAAP
jgi:hypothetical protein